MSLHDMERSARRRLSSAFQNYIRLPKWTIAARVELYGHDGLSIPLCSLGGPALPLLLSGFTARRRVSTAKISDARGFLRRPLLSLPMMATPVAIALGVDDWMFHPQLGILQ